MLLRRGERDMAIARRSAICCSSGTSAINTSEGRGARPVHDAVVVFLAFIARAATLHLPDIFARSGRRLGCAPPRNGALLQFIGKDDGLQHCCPAASLAQVTIQDQQHEHSIWGFLVFTFLSFSGSHLFLGVVGTRGHETAMRKKDGEREAQPGRDVFRGKR